jgi:hypothetical protein
MALKEWVLVKWKVLQEQQAEVQKEWEDACRRHKRARGMSEEEGVLLMTLGFKPP